jgi:hypothetical protein
MEGELEVGLCPVCNEYRHDLHHNGTVNHRFHFAKWQYNEFSKPLSNNRHGIVLDAQAEQVNNFRFIFKYIRGKYTVKQWLCGDDGSGEFIRFFLVLNKYYQESRLLQTTLTMRLKLYIFT